MSLELSLSIQYGTDAPELPRWRLRSWVRRTLAALDALRREAADDADGPVAMATGLNRVALGLRLVDSDEGRDLNRGFRHKDYATNVLTFEYGLDPDGTASADVVLCMPVLRREADEQGKPLLDHAAHLVVHGVLHSLGYDHLEPQEAERMEALETRILAGMRIPDPYAA